MKPIIAYNYDNEKINNFSFIGLFKSASDAARILNIPKSLISKCLNDKYHITTAHKYHFDYLEKIDNLIDFIYCFSDLDNYNQFLTDYNKVLTDLMSEKN